MAQHEANAEAVMTQGAWSMRQLTLGAVIALSMAAVGEAAVLVPPANLGELAASSDAVVLAVAGDSRVERRGALYFTVTPFTVAEALAGQAAAGATLEVVVPGGELDGRGWAITGAPRFQPGAAYLLPLALDGAGRYRPVALAYGVLRQLSGTGGEALLAPLAEAEDVGTFARPDGLLPEPLATYREGTLLAHLSAVAAGRAAWDASGVVAPPGAVPIVARAQSIPSACTFLTDASGTPGAVDTARGRRLCSGPMPAVSRTAHLTAAAWWWYFGTSGGRVAAA